MLYNTVVLGDRKRRVNKCRNLWLKKGVRWNNKPPVNGYATTTYSFVRMNGG
jgi:hypothetical protein